jgi:hypothetical protein
VVRRNSGRKRDMVDVVGSAREMNVADGGYGCL